MIFTSSKVTGEKYCQIASGVTKIVIHGNPYIILFLTHYFMPWTDKFAKIITDSFFAMVAENGRFWVRIARSPQLICDITRTQDTGIETSYSSMFLFAQIGEKYIPTNE